MRFVVATVLAVCGLMGVAATAPAAGPPSYAQFLKARNEKLGAWLPQGESLFEPSRRHLAVRSTALGAADLLAVPEPSTYFWYGSAGPPRVHVVYDRIHGIALYDQGCCSWSEVVLIAARVPPPDRVVSADLSTKRTPHGIGLGASPQAVMNAYGRATLHANTGAPALRELSYYQVEPHPSPYSSCGWYTNFVFRHERVWAIQTGHGC